MRKFDLRSYGVEYVLPGILGVVLIITGGVLLIFVEWVVVTGWGALSGGVFILLLLLVMWRNDGP